MKLRRLELDRFTAFEQAIFEFAPGVNVIIGENGTGKSHVLKLIYSLSEAIRRHATGEGLDTTLRKPELDEVFAETLAAVFQPDELGRLVRRGAGHREARIHAVWREGATERHLEATLSSLGRLELSHS